MENETRESGAVHKALETLAGLRRSTLGTVIYDQLAQVVQDYEQQCTKLDRTYGLLLQLLLEAYVKNPTPEAVVALSARLINLRRGEAPPRSEVEKQNPAAESMNVEDDCDIPEDPDPENPQTERRINTAYRLHLDRKRDEIEKLQESLSQSIDEAITQNREFGALLKIELGALKQADGAAEIEDLRRILIGGVEELINGQHLLESKLHRTGDYLNLVKADSDRLREELHKVRLLSLTDEFTGLPNRRAFMRRLQDEIGRAQRYGTPLALVLVDLDEFKSINDAHGHAGGDEVLRCYAAEVLSVLRHHDMVARYGGEEFAVMLPNTAEKGAIAAISKVRQRAREVSCRVGDKAIALPTFSAGVAMYRSGESPLQFIERADRALYAAKAQGRDRIQTAIGNDASLTPAASDSLEADQR